jgi:hypothetical protein
MVDGVLPLPQGFPRDIPVETEEILESAVAHYPDLPAPQLYLRYSSAKSIAEKYAQYMDYMRRAGYAVTQHSTTSPAKEIVGTKPKEGTNLSVVIRSAGGKTLVDLSYLLRSVSN